MQPCSDFQGHVNGHALTFDDVLLVPQYSELESRSKANISVELFFKNFQIPIISSNMDTVTGYSMAKAMANLGGFGILHRYMSPEQVLEEIKSLKLAGCKMIVPSIGVQFEDIERANKYIEAGADAVCIDIAHGYSKAMLRMIRNLPSKKLIVGNVCTYEATLAIAKEGVTAIKVGVGNGSLCTTRIVTGHGIPQLTAISEAARVKKLFPQLNIIADGGIRNSGDCVKAFAFGADVVMVGGLLAGTDETPGEVIECLEHLSPNLPISKKFKYYRGMASSDAQIAFRGKIGNGMAEGVATEVPYKGPVNVIINELLGGIRSGLSYSGAFNLKELKEKAKFVLMTNNGYIESTPHGKK